MTTDNTRVHKLGDGLWLVRLDGGLRVDTHHGLARAVGKIPFAERRRGGSYRLEGVFSQGGYSWARIFHAPPCEACAGLGTYDGHALYPGVFAPGERGICECCGGTG